MHISCEGSVDITQLKELFPFEDITIENPGRMKYSVSGNDIELSPVLANRSFAWELFLKHISTITPNEIPHGEQTIRLIEEKISKIDTSYKPMSESLEDIEENPERYLKVAIKLQNTVNKLFFQVAGHTLHIHENRFHPHLDEAERQILKMFVLRFEHEIDKDDFGAALGTICQMGPSVQGSQSSLKLAKYSLENGEMVRVFMALSHIKLVNHVKSELAELTHLIFKKGDAEECYQYLRNSNNENLASFMISELVTQALNEKNLSKTIDIINQAGNEKTQENSWKKLTETLISQNKYDEAEKIIPKIAGQYDKDRYYKNIIEHYLKKGQLDQTLRLIPLLSNSYERDCQIKIIIDSFLKKCEYESARSYLNDIENSYDKDEYCLKLVKVYVKSKDIASAKDVIILMNNKYEKGKAYKMIVNAI